ncbi:hypothetical protein [Flavobacterium soyae]|uniref:hypothetical protein n=1 Tax=Flavobacterium soyae TaxID=2903098 RepID=UPI001E46973C|nr:hypothetical protein [Flavobacterium soyae]MCD9577355.1 hypothetical protein [Flavobacterium soyae]
MKKINLNQWLIMIFASFTSIINSQTTLPIVGFNDANNYTIGHYSVPSSSGLDIHWYGGIRFGDWTSRSVMQITNGKVGIGSTAPSANLEITSTAVVGAETLLKLNVTDASKDYLKIANSTNTDGQFMPCIEGYHITDNRAALYLTGSIDGLSDNGANPIMVFDSRISSSAVVNRPLFSWDSFGARKMILTSNGSLGIGTTTTGTHKLAVEGSIGAREVKVQAAGWADFVFKKEYDLPTLEEIEMHIKEKGHLENIPNEEEVLKDGINLGEMNAKLLQKIEELTLYVIEQNKQIKNLQNSLEIIKKDNCK